MDLKPHSYSGYFITLEGGEGAGKSTQVKKLLAYFEAKNQPVIATREPGGTDEAECLRSLLIQKESYHWSPMSEALLMFAARRQHADDVIWPALQSGKIVVCDRFTDSTYAYQGIAMGLGGPKIETLNRVVMDDFMPDLTFIFDLDPEIGLQRSLKRNQTISNHMAGQIVADKNESRPLSFHQNLRKAYLDIARNNPSRCHIIDAAQSEETIFSSLITHIDEFQRLRVSHAV
jgi:dTMP kinase